MYICIYNIYIYIYIYKDKIKKRMELLSLDRPGRLTDATRGYKNEKKSTRNTGTRIHTHDIHTPAARLKRIRLKWNTFTYTMPARARR